MKFISIVFTALTLHVTILNGKNLPSLIKKCKRSDPYLNDCVRRTMMDLRGYLQSGIRKLELVPMDPYVLPKAVVSTHWMNSTFENVTVYRMHAFEIDSIRLDFDKNPFIVMDYHHPYLEINSHYRLDGNLLEIPIHGRGELESKFNNSKSFLSIDGRKIKRNGKEYMQLDEADYKLRENSLEYLYLHNLIEGNQELTDMLNRFFLENKDVFYAELSPLTNKVTSIVLLSLFKGVFDKFSLDELFD